jgi:acetaldehyde dehydrogenase
MTNKIKVGIIGSGNIGTDLLMKIQRSDLLECAIFVGRNLNSKGMKKANEAGVRISDKSIQFFIDEPDAVDIVFDATTATFHKRHAPIFAELGIKAIDMTPSQIGDMCVPAINLGDCADSNNVNMITCGGQASIPIAHCIAKTFKDVRYIEVVSVIASKSAGPGTRDNLDEYIENTEKGLRELAICENVKAIININPAEPSIDMQTSIFAYLEECDLSLLEAPITAIVEKIQQYVPGYKIAINPIYENNRLMVMIRVKGLGDYLPAYAGNLDIINCAAISVAEAMAAKMQLLRIEHV